MTNVLSMAEILTHYSRKTDMPEAERRSTPVRTLMERMTPEERDAAKFTDEQLAQYLKGGAEAVEIRA